MNDRSHGSADLLQMFYSAVDRHPHIDNESLRMGLDKLKEVDQSMAVVHHFVKELKDSSVNHLAREIERYRNVWSEVNDQIAHNMDNTINPDSKTILTHSNSSTVRYCLNHFHATGRPFHVLQTISNPGGEGRKMFNEMKKSGISTALLPDDRIVDHLDEIDLILLGADQFTDTHFVNKQGSARICEMADRNNKMVMILSDSRKKVDELTIGNKLFESVVFGKSTSFFVTESDVVQFSGT